MRVRSFLLLLLPGLLFGQNLQEFEKKVTSFTLANGLTFLVIERHDAPVVSFHTYVNAGAVDDPTGRTGLAHMFEHMAFKLSLIHISEPTRLLSISYAVF